MKLVAQRFEAGTAHLTPQPRPAAYKHQLSMTQQAMLGEEGKCNMSQKTSLPACLFPLDLHQHRGVRKQSGFPNDALRNHLVFFIL